MNRACKKWVVCSSKLPIFLFSNMLRGDIFKVERVRQNLNFEQLEKLEFLTK